VSISGDTVVVGANGDDDNGSDSGSAYIFGRDQGGADAWGQVAKLTASDGASGDQFGSIGFDQRRHRRRRGLWDDDNGSDSGSAYVFGRDQGGADAWGQVAKLTASDGASGDSFGRSVSISGDTVVVGAYGDDDNGSDSGSAYIFSRDQGGADAWGQVAKLTASDGASDDSSALRFRSAATPSSSGPIWTTTMGRTRVRPTSSVAIRGALMPGVRWRNNPPPWL
jgi:hypothetical protein